MLISVGKFKMSKVFLKNNQPKQKYPVRGTDLFLLNGEDIYVYKYINEIYIISIYEGIIKNILMAFN